MIAVEILHHRIKPGSCFSIMNERLHSGEYCLAGHAPLSAAATKQMKILGVFFDTPSKPVMFEAELGL